MPDSITDAYSRRNIDNELQSRMNDAIGDFGRQTKQQFNYALRQQNFAARGRSRKADDTPLRNRVGVRFHQSLGSIDRIMWKFRRHGIFQERGVGRGRGIGSGKEKPHLWLEQTLSAQVPMLADVLSEAAFQAFVPVIRIKVPGIFEAELRP